MPTDAKSAAAATELTTLLRIALLSIIKSRVEHHRNTIPFFFVQLCISRNYNGYLRAVTSLYHNFNFRSLTPRGGCSSRRKGHSPADRQPAARDDGKSEPGDGGRRRAHSMNFRSRGSLGGSPRRRETWLA